MNKPRTTLYEICGDGRLQLHLHKGQYKAWTSTRRFIFVLAGTQGGKTSFGAWWLWKEIEAKGAGDYIAASSSYDLFKLKMLPEIRNTFEHILKIGRYWAGDKIMEIRNPETGEFSAKRADDPMWARIILRSASAEGGLESSTAKAAWLDEVGQDEFGLDAWEAVLRRLSLNEGRVLGTTTLYNLGWLKQKIYNAWERGDKDIDIIQFASVDNPMFPQSEFERAKRTLPDWKFNMQYRGVYERPAGMIYRDFIDKHKDQGGHKVKPFDLPKEWARYAGVDPGANNTAMLWAAHDQEHDIYYLYRESLEGGKSTKEHAQAADMLAQKNGERVIWYAVGQKAEEQTRLDWKAAGVPNVVEPLFHDVEAGIDKVIALLREFRIYFFDTLDKTLDQIGTYAREVDEAGEPLEKIKNKEKYHMLDALRYLAVQIQQRPARLERAANPFYGGY
jgi:hypothetical protein